jgi:transposase
MANSLGLNEFKIVQVLESDDNRSIMYEVVSAHPPKVCPFCGCLGPFYKHSTNERIVHDMPVHGKSVFLKVKTQRYKCRDCESTFYESFKSIDGRERITARLRAHIKERSLKDTFTRIANDCNLSVNTIRRIFKEFVDDNEQFLVYKAPTVLGIDEAHLNKTMRCVLTDTEHNLLLDILPDRETTNIVRFLKRVPDCQNIKVVTMDMYAPYRLVIQKALPAAKIVVDKFHVVQLANRKMDEVRKSFMDGLSKQERSNLRYISNLMKSNSEDISDHSASTLKEAFVRFPQLGIAYFLKERIRGIYAAKSRDEAGELFLRWCDCVPEDMAPFITARNTYKQWSREIFNYFDHPYTNAYTEAANNLIKKIDKEGRSLSFEQLRYKALFSTKATQLPRFKPKNAVFIPSETLSRIASGPSSYVPPKVVQGFGVDIKVLNDVLSEF